jgi:3-deoxy-D-manno-octulosonic-acid transferase
LLALLVYNLLLLLLSPLLLAFLLYRLAKGKEDAARWGERWGAYPAQVAADKRAFRFWVHAVSVGEVMAAAPVLRELRRRYPDALIVLSTTTPTGHEVAQKQVPPADEVVYYPLDFTFAVKRAVTVVRPNVVLLMEWEIWPNFLHAAKAAGATVAVLNGRVSDKGLRRGGRATFFLKPGLDAVDRFVMQSEEDARRAALVGADPAKVLAVGNTKFDESAAMLTPDERAVLRGDLGIPDGAPVLVCGSTRNAAPSDKTDEEAFLAEAVAEVRKRFPDLRVIVAPRHLDRADAAAAPFRELGMTVARRSEGGRAGDVLLLDTFGELARVYAVADAAFVGGSLVRQGGQSVFQPLAQGVPALFGPYMNNQRDIAALAQAEGVGFLVPDAAGLAEELVRLLAMEPERRARLSHRARALIDRNQGVTARSLDAVEAVWNNRPRP